MMGSYQKYNVIGHIDLPERRSPERKSRPEDFKNFLEARMKDIRTGVNEGFGYNLLDEENKISMEDTPDSEADKKEVSDIENNFAREQHKTLEEWRLAKDRNPATITEMAVTLALHRLLGDRFIVARAAAIDDYENHVDNVLIDKVTGAVVCGFDEVISLDRDGSSEKKDKKTKKNLSHGGTSLKYGATIVDGKIERKSLENIPTFFLSLSREELISLSADLQANKLPTDNEKKIVLKLVSSLEDQYKEAKSVAFNYNLKQNLNNFAASLEIIKKQINQ